MTIHLQVNETNPTEHRNLLLHWALVSLAGALPFVILGSSEAALIPVLAGLCLLFPKRSHLFLISTGILSLLLRPAYFVDWFFFLKRRSPPYVDLSYGIIFVGAYLIIVAAQTGLVRLLRWPRLSQWRAAVALCAFFLSVGAIWGTYAQSAQGVSTFTLVFVYSWAWSLPSFAMTVMSDDGRTSSPLELAATLSPGWLFGNVVYPVGTISRWQASAARGRSQLARIQISGAKHLCIAGVLIIFFRHILPPLLEGWYPSQYIVYETTRQFSKGISVSVPQAWGAVLLDLAFFIGRLLAIGHMAVGILKLSGVNVFRNTYRVFESNSAIQFFERYNYHFKEYLFRTAFWPIFTRLRLRSIPLRFFASLLGSVGLLNALNHSVLVGSMFRLNYPLSLTKSVLISWFFSYLIYSVLLAILLLPSAMHLLFEAPSVNKKSFLRHIAELGSTIAALAAIRVFEAPPWFGIKTNLQLFLRLLGISFETNLF